MGSNADGMNREADLNMVHLNLPEFIEYIQDRINMEEYDMPVLGLGKSGIGKTESMEAQIAGPMGIGMISLRLGDYDDTDLTGLPIPEKDEKLGKTMVTFADVSILPQAERDGERGILVLDEFTNATARVRSAALKLTDKDRGVGSYKLPPKWLVVVLGNGPGDGGFYQGLEYALMGRADCFRIDVDFPAWKAWAVHNNVHPTVISFIERNGGVSMLHKIKDMDEAEYEEKDANPRCWVKLSTHLKNKEARLGKMLTERQVEIYAGGAVGADLAAEFSAFYRYQKELISVEDIFSGKALTLQLSGYKTETLYINMIHIANAMTSLLENNREKILADEPLDSASEKSVGNTIKFVSKLAAERSRDIATTVFPTIASATDLWINYTLQDDFDDKFPEYLEMGIREQVLTESKTGFEHGMKS